MSMDDIKLSDTDCDDIGADIDATTQSITNPGDATWIYDPPTLHDYWTSGRYTGKPPLTDVQYGDIIRLLGDDPKQIFNGGSPYNIGVLLEGKGSGKDWQSAGVEGYLGNVLACMRNPQAYFGLGPGTWIELLNCSMSEDHAKRIYFEYLKWDILNNAFLKSIYSIYESGSLAKIPGNTEGKPHLEINDGEIDFVDKHIRLRAVGSDNETFEGGAPIYWAMTEASQFKLHTKVGNSKKIYDTLRTSSVSRYGRRWKGLVSSYPRSEVDFTVSMYHDAVQKEFEEMKSQSGEVMKFPIFGVRRCTWDVLPKSKYCGRTFRLEPEGIEIPVEYEAEFLIEPEDSRSKYMCLPPAVEDAFFKFRERIPECIDPDRLPLFTTQTAVIEVEVEGINRKYLAQVIDWIRDKSHSTLMTPHVIHVDGGVSRNAAAMCVAHGEPITINRIDRKTGKVEAKESSRVIVDALIRWVPDKSRGLQVSLDSIEDLIMALKGFMKISKVTYDQWNSQTSIERLQKNGIPAIEHTINNEDYFDLRTLVYSGAVSLPAKFITMGNNKYEYKEVSQVIKELSELKLIGGKKVDHPPESENGSKDLSDSLCGCAYDLNDLVEKRTSNGRLPRGSVGMGFTRATPSPFSPAANGIMEAPGELGIKVGGSPPQGVMPGQALGWVEEYSGRMPLTPRQNSGTFPRGVVMGGGMGGLSPQDPRNSLPEHLRGM